jgi:hypothetical protein
MSPAVFALHELYGAEIRNNRVEHGLRAPAEQHGVGRERLFERMLEEFGKAGHRIFLAEWNRVPLRPCGEDTQSVEFFGAPMNLFEDSYLFENLGHFRLPFDPLSSTTEHQPAVP